MRGSFLRRAPRLLGSRLRETDAGFSLIEAVVASMLITLTMAALTSFFVTANLSTHRQGGTQVAVSLADSATEEVRAVAATAVAALQPTLVATIDDIPYTVTRVTSPCWQPHTQTNGDCGSVRTPGDAGFLRVVVTVSWPERQCPDATCTYTTSTLISSVTDEPFFDSDQDG